MNTHAGYSKKTLTDTNVLLAGGGDKSLVDFIGGIQYVSASHKLLIKTAASNASWADLVTLVMTDENVKLVDNNNDLSSPILLKNGTGTGTITSTSIFADGVTVNPKNNALEATGSLKSSKHLTTNYEIAETSSGNRLCFGSYSLSVAKGINVGDLLVSNAWADYTKVPTNGIYSKGQIKSGVTSGTSPFNVTSATVNINLNADLLDDYHANQIEDIYHGAWCSGTGTYWGKVAEYKYNGSGKIDISATFLVSRYATEGSGTVNILNIRIRGNSKSSSKNCSATWSLNTNNAIPVTVTHIYNSNDGYYYVRIYFRSGGWGETYGCKLLNSHLWESPSMTSWTMYHGMYAGSTTIQLFTDIPSDETIIAISTLSINNNAATATKLATARKINGTDFDGTADITTAKWGISRTLTIGNTGKPVDGSENVSWSLSEIGAEAAGHNHTLSIAIDSGTNKITLAASTKYKLTAGGNTYVFTTPPDTWVANAVGVAGYVAAPTKAANANMVWKCDANGNPGWRTDADTWIANSASDAGYVGVPSATSVWMANADKVPAWRTVSGGSTTLAWNTESTIATIGTVTIKVKLPANPNTDNDTKVTQSNTTTSNWRAIVVGYSNASKNSTDLYASVTNRVYVTNVLQYLPSTGTLSTKILESTITSGTAPINVTSTTLVNNLNVDLLDNYHANLIENIYHGGWCAGSGTYYGKVAEYKNNASGTIDISATFLISRYGTGGSGTVNILNIRARGNSKSSVSCTATWSLNTNNSVPITVTHVYDSSTGYYYIRIYFQSSDWGETYGCKLLNSHQWSAPTITNWTLYNGTYSSSTTILSFSSIPSNETVLTISTLSISNNAAQDHYKTSPGAGTAGTSSATSGSTLSVPYVTVNANGHVTAYGTHTHTISGFLTAQDHYKTSPGAGTAGTSSATSGSTLAVPYVTVNANGHVTGYGTHTHTVTGFLTSHLSVTNSNPNIKYGNTMTIGSVGGTNLQITLPNNEGTSDFTDSTELLTSYASNNGFADTNAPGVIYRRKAVSMYNYLVSKGFLTSHQTVSGTFWGNSWSNGGSLSGKITVAADGWAGLLLLNRTNNGSNWGASIAFQGSGSNRGAIHMEGNELYVGDVSGTFRYKVLTENNWNSTISVTGGDGDTKYYLTLNGTNKGHTSGTSLGSFYAPTGSGTSGLILKSNGANSAPTWINNSHTLSIATTTDSSSITLAANTKYKLTAGGSTYVFTTPPDQTGSGGDLATKAKYLTNYADAYTDPGLGAYSLSYYTSMSSTTSASTNGIANPSSSWYYHMTMIHGDSTGYFCDVAWRLNDHSDPSMYFRIRNASNYTGWVKVLTSENYTDYISSSSGGTSVYQYHNQSMSSNTNYRILTSTRTSNGTLENVYSKSACYMNDNGVYFTSDKKMKKDIRMFSLETNIMDCYNPVRRFSWKSNDMPSIGFISQEVEEWCPEAVGISDDGLKTVNYDVALSALCGAMFNRIKELEQTVKELQYQININKR